MIRTLVADDVDAVREGIRLLLAGTNDFEVIAEARNGIEAATAINDARPDVAFLDVEMPGCDGFEVLRRLGRARRPYVIFVTAHSRYAPHAFDVDAQDYLLKPFSDRRFEEALERVRARLVSPPEGARHGHLFSHRLVVRDRQKVAFVRTDDLEWVQADGNYVLLHLRDRVIQMRVTLSELERQLDARKFVRVHRQFVVNAERVREVLLPAHEEPVVLLESGVKLPLGRTYRGSLLPPIDPS
jgi:two-component system LytT family response regulator